VGVERRLSVRTFATVTNVLALLVLIGSVMCATVALGWWAIDHFPFSVAASFHRWISLALAVLAAVILVVAIATARRSNAVVAGVVTIASLSVTLLSAVATTAPVSVEAMVDKESSSVRVAAWNVESRGTWEQLSWLIGATEADVIVLSEQYLDVRSPINNARLAGYQLLSDPNVAVTVLISEKLGEYRVAGADLSGATSGVVVEPVDGHSGSPRIVGVHVTRQSLIGGATLWERGLDWVAEQCSGTGPTIAAGDFNSTVENLPGGRLGECRLSGSSSRGEAASWPSSWPPYFGIGIDRGMASGELHAANAFTLDARPDWSDHRPVVVDFEPAEDR